MFRLQQFITILWLNWSLSNCAHVKAKTCVCVLASKDTFWFWVSLSREVEGSGVGRHSIWNFDGIMTLLLVGRITDLHPGHLGCAANSHFLRGGNLTLPARFTNRSISVSLKRNQIIDICPAVEVMTSTITLQKEGKRLLVFPDGLHLLSVVAHVALQPNALWSALQHQLRGRCTCKSVTCTFDYAR